jgi:hypothetical protein
MSLDAAGQDHAAAGSTYIAAGRAVRDCTPMPLVLNSLAEWLPRLGTALWIDRREVAAPTHARSASGDGLILLDHPAASALARCASLRAHSAVTPQGPREWLCFHDEHREVTAKLFLLPDTDCLAWDQMAAANGLAAAEPAAHEPPGHSAFLRRALARFGHRWHARLLVFDFKQLPWLQTLGARAPLRISLLGLDVARAIVRNENAEWVSPLHIA